jgi:hypothetical protein
MPTTKPQFQLYSQHSETSIFTTSTNGLTPCWQSIGCPIAAHLHQSAAHKSVVGLNVGRGGVIVELGLMLIPQWDVQSVALMFSMMVNLQWRMGSGTGPGFCNPFEALALLNDMTRLLLVGVSWDAFR